jgi:hypothetical protein
VGPFLVLRLCCEVAICANFLTASLAATVKAPEAPTFPRGGEREDRRISVLRPLAPGATSRP